MKKVAKTSNWCNTLRGVLEKYAPADRPKIEQLDFFEHFQFDFKI
jgi:hypothetical protein